MDEIIFVDFEKNIPIKINGIPKPAEYANNKLNETDGIVAANVRIVPNIGPTHGVHPIAKAKPNTKDIG